MFQMVSIVMATIAFATACVATTPALRTSYSIETCGISSGAAGHSLKVSVVCPAGLHYRISLLEEPRCGRSRTMASAKTGRKIRYFLLTPDRSAVWCDGTNGTVAVNAVGSGVTQDYIAVSSTLDRRALATDLNAVDYADTVVVYVESP